MISTTTALLMMINSVRQQPLIIDKKLTQIAQVRCVNMKDWSHTDYFNVYSKKVHKLGYFYTGENLASGFNNPQDMFTALQNSPTHKENNQNTNYKKIGIAHCKNQIGNVTVFEFAGKK